MVVDVDEDVVVVPAQGVNHTCRFAQFAVLWLDDPVPGQGGVPLHNFPVAAGYPDNHRTCKPLPFLSVHPVDRRRVPPLQEDMAQSVFGEGIDILAPQPVRQPPAEHLEQLEKAEIAARLPPVEVIDLEHQQADMLAKESHDQSGGEDVWIGDEDRTLLLR